MLKYTGYVVGRKGIIAFFSTDKMNRTDIAVHCRMPVLTVDSGNPALATIMVDREAVERQRASFSQAVGATSDFQPRKINYLSRIIWQLPVIDGPQRAEICTYDVKFV